MTKSMGGEPKDRPDETLLPKQFRQNQG